VTPFPGMCRPMAGPRWCVYYAFPALAAEGCNGAIVSTAYKLAYATFSSRLLKRSSYLCSCARFLALCQPHLPEPFQTLPPVLLQHAEQTG
jgi:hypothetical protein